jgi:hypothetical protein
MSILRIIVLVVLASVTALTSANDGWEPLFDGTSLRGWRASEHPDSWQVRDGALVASGPRAHLFYEGPSGGATFRNFELQAEVKTEPGANSGIYFHTAWQERDWPSQGMEVQINNTHVGEGEWRERRKTGSLYGIRNVYSAIVKDGEWFRLHVAVRGTQVQVRVNDVLTVDYVQADPPVTGVRTLGTGTFALQAHDPHSVVAFRNLRVRRLPDDARAQAPPPVADETYRELLRLSAGNYPVVDYHTHLKGFYPIQDALRRWREQGIYAGVAVNGGLGFPISDDAGLEAFLEEMRGQPAFVALQGEGREWTGLFSRRTLERFDYIFTDAMTWTDDDGKRMRLWIAPEVGTITDPQRFMDTLVARTVRIIETEPIDLHVNPTFLPEQLASQYDQLWTSARMQRVVDALRATGVGVEINARYRIPSAAFIRLGKSAGLKFACGTNNTSAEDVGRLEYCIEMIRTCDLKWQDMWVPPAEGQKAVQRKPLGVTQR